MNKFLFSFAILVFCYGAVKAEPVTTNEEMPLAFSVLTPETREALETRIAAMRALEVPFFEKYRNEVKASRPPSQILTELNHSPVGSQKEQELKEELKVMLPTWRRMQEEYDTMMLSRFDLFADFQVELGKTLAGKVASIAKSKDGKKITSLVTDLEKLGNDYKEKKSLFGQGKDYQRLSTMVELLGRVQQITKEVDKVITKERPKKGITQWMNDKKLQFWNKAKSMVATGGILANVLPKALPAIIHVLNPYYKTPKDSTPLVDGYLSTVQTLAKSTGLTIDIKGRENLILDAKDKEVILYSPEHNTALLDFMMVGNLGLENTVLFGATDLWGFPTKIAKKLENTNDIITVGTKTTKPVEKTLSLINGTPKDGSKTQKRKFLIFPEGWTSGGIFDTRPIRDKFASGMIQDIINQGFDPIIVPIAFPGSLRYQNTVPQASDNEQTRKSPAVVQPPITKRTLNVIQDGTGNMADVVYLMRQLFWEALENENPEQPIAGVGSVSGLIEHHEKVFRGNINCANLVKLLGTN